MTKVIVFRLTAEVRDGGSKPALFQDFKNWDGREQHYMQYGDVTFKPVDVKLTVAR